MKRISRERRKQIDQEIKRVGKPVLKSKYFEMAKGQVHHYKTNVYQHSIQVARNALIVSDFFEKKGKNVDRELVVLGALCHDLGIVGRFDKYANNVECCIRHPIDSATIASEIIPDISPRLIKMIKGHMWPLVFSVPTRIEELVLIIADKITTFQDLRKKSSSLFYAH